MSQSKRILLTGSRAPGTLELARMLAAFGHYVVAADSVRFELCRSSQACRGFYQLPPPNFDPQGFKRRLLQLIQREKIDLLIPTCEEIFHIAGLKEELSLHCQVFCASLPVMKRLHHKGDFIAWAQSLGLSVPETHVFSGREAPPSLDTIQQCIKTTKGFVVKPSYTRFSNEVFLAPSGHLEHFDPAALARGRDLIVQAFIPGQQICTYSIVLSGRIIAHSSYRTHYAAGIGATIHFVEDHHVGCRRWVESFVAQTDFTGQIAFDFIEDAQGQVSAIECNPRLTSGVHLIADCDLPSFLEGGVPSNYQIPPPKGPSMISLAMLIYALPQALKKADGLRDFARSFSSARDLIYAQYDPWPALAQFLVYIQFSIIAYLRGIKAIEASTYDIQWEEGADAR